MMARTYIKGGTRQEQHLRASRKYYATHRQERIAAAKKWAEEHKEERANSRRRRTVATYGITPAEYDLLLTAQGGVCAICHRHPQTKRLNVDHDHKKVGRESVRGLLCHLCNRSLENTVQGHQRRARSEGTVCTCYTCRYYMVPPARDILKGGD